MKASFTFLICDCSYAIRERQIMKDLDSVITVFTARVNAPRVIWTKRQGNIGLGEILSATAKRVGLKHCGNCEKRAQALNRVQLKWPR